MAGIKIKDLPVAATLSASDYFEVSQNIASVQTSGRVTLSQLTAAIVTGYAPSLTAVLAIGNSTLGYSIKVNDGDAVILGDANVGLLFYDAPYSRLVLKNSISTDYLLFNDAGDCILKSETGKISSDGVGNFVQLDWSQSGDQIQMFNTQGGIGAYPTHVEINHLGEVRFNTPKVTTKSGITTMVADIVLSATNSIELDSTVIKLTQATPWYFQFVNASGNLTDSMLQHDGSGNVLLASGRGFDTPTAAGTLYYGATNSTTLSYGNVSATHTFLGTVMLPTNSPALALEAASKGYVDSLIEGLDWKEQVVTATTANITLSGVQGVNGIIVGAGERVLVKNQTTQTENGIYISGPLAWTRSADCSTGSELEYAVVEVNQGGDTGKVYRCNTYPINLGVTNITFAEWNVASYTNGYGLSLVGTTFSVTTGMFLTTTLTANTTVNLGAYNLTLDAGANTARLIINATNATDAKILSFRTNTLQRWALRVDSAGDDFAIRRYDNAGAYLDSPLSISRSTGVVTLTSPLPTGSGGTGVANGSNNTITFTGNYSLGLTLTAATSVTLPTTGTLATLAGSETFTNKTLTVPLLSNSTSNTAGALGYDGTVFYHTPNSNNQGVSPAVHFIRHDATYTLTSTTSVQQLFDGSTNGRITLPVGTYRFSCMFRIQSMDTTSGNAAFSLAGTATTGTHLWTYYGVDTAPTTGPYTLNGGCAVTNATAASMQAASAANSMVTTIAGTFEVTVTGTVIPSIALVNAAAGIVSAGSYFECWAIGSDSVDYVGEWD